jgi:hypothetical protein
MLIERLGGDFSRNPSKHVFQARPRGRVQFLRRATQRLTP